MAAILQRTYTYVKCIFFNKIHYILIQVSLNFVLNVPNKSAADQLMACRLFGLKEFNDAGLCHQARWDNYCTIL